MTATTILVVEDEADIRLTLRVTLELEGYRVVSARSAEEATGLLERETPDAMLLDIGLPGMDGMDLLARVRDRGARDLPIVVTSAFTGVDSMEAASRLGSNAYLRKPFTPGDLLATLERVLSERRDPGG